MKKFLSLSLVTLISIFFLSNSAVARDGCGSGERLNEYGACEERK